MIYSIEKAFDYWLVDMPFWKGYRLNVGGIHHSSNRFLNNL